MPDYLFAIISNVPERISQYTSALRSTGASFQFFSNLSSFLNRQPYSNLQLIILDAVDKDLDVADCTRKLRSFAHFSSVTIVVIVKEPGSDCGIAALTAGCNDYLPYALVEKELAPRVRVHLNAQVRTPQYHPEDTDVDLEQIYPLEDRALARSALWSIKNDMASLKSVNDLSIYIGRSEREINRVFNEHFGQTAFSYIREFRIKRAKKMLTKTRWTITQIAQEVGYSSSANFSTAFKSVVGVSPREFRQQELSST